MKKEDQQNSSPEQKKLEELVGKIKKTEQSKTYMDEESDQAALESWEESLPEE